MQTGRLAFFFVPHLELKSVCKPPSEFVGDDERLDHLGALEVAVELVQLVEPELIAVGGGASQSIPSSQTSRCAWR
jgi:hypothetical protein